VTALIASSSSIEESSSSISAETALCFYFEGSGFSARLLLGASLADFERLEGFLSIFLDLLLPLSIWKLFSNFCSSLALFSLIS